MKFLFCVKDGFVLMARINESVNLYAASLHSTELSAELQKYRGSQVQVFLADSEETMLFAKEYGIQGEVILQDEKEPLDFGTLMQIVAVTNVRSVEFEPAIGVVAPRAEAPEEPVQVFPLQPLVPFPGVVGPSKRNGNVGPKKGGSNG